MTTTGVEERESKVDIQRRYLRRKGQAGEGFLPWGLLPLLAFGLLTLFALIPFSKGWVERRAVDSAEVALNAAGENWVKVSASGQWVTLEGEAPSSASAARAIQLVREAKARTPFGLAQPVTRINDRISLGTDTTSPSSRVRSVTSGQVLPDWRFEIEDTTLVLRGEVVGSETKTAVLDAVRAALPTEGFSDFRDELRVAEGIPSPAYQEVALRGATAISFCKYGYVALQQEAFDLDCDVSAAHEVDLAALMASALPLGRKGETDIRLEQTAEACDARLARVLAETKFEFESGSARIGSQNDPLLDRLLVAIGTCPGGFVIEGHTDATGSSTTNQRLSQSRAEVVRMALVERGLTPSRLSARGYGASQPLADNATPAGRAQNRRIEIKMRQNGATDE